MSPLRRIVGSAAVLATLLLLYLISLIAVVRTSRQDQRRPVGAIVVLGAAQYNGRPSPVLRARLDHARELYMAGLAPRIVVTGGTREGDRESEASVGGRYLAARGVPWSALVVLPEGRSTEGSIRSLTRWGTAEAVSSFLLVSDPFHMLRLRLEARRAHLTAYLSPTRTSPISGYWRDEWWYFAAEALKVPIAWLRSL